MNKSLILIFLAIIIVIGSAYILVQKNVSSNNKLFNSENIKNPDYNEGSPEGYAEAAQYSGEDSGSASLPNTYQDPNGQTCYPQQLQYSLKKFLKSSECLSYNEGGCIEKVADCSLELTNLDAGNSGEFTLQADFFETIGETISVSETSETLSPGESKQITISETFTGDNAKKNISCSMNTKTVPEKQVCI